MKCLRKEQSQIDANFFQKWDVQFSCSLLSDSLWPHGLQHARLTCPSPTPGACLKSCPLSRWCHLTISSSAVSFSFCLQSFPASGSLQWVSSSHQIAKVLEFQLQHQSKSWKMMLWKCCTQYASRFGKFSSGHRTGKGQFSFQSQRKAMPKNAQTTV